MTQAPDIKDQDQHPRVLQRTVRLNAAPASQIGSVLGFISQHNHLDLREIIEQLLKSAYLIPALKDRVSQEELKRLGYECSSILEGYVRQVRSLTGIEEGGLTMAANAIVNPNDRERDWTSVPTNFEGNGAFSDSTDEDPEDEENETMRARLRESQQLFSG